MTHAFGVFLIVCFSVFLIARRRLMAEQMWGGSRRSVGRRLLNRAFGEPEPRAPSPPKYYEYVVIAFGSLLLAVGLVALAELALNAAG
jgi:hypothetical protein